MPLNMDESIGSIDLLSTQIQARWEVASNEASGELELTPDYIHATAYAPTFSMKATSQTSPPSSQKVPFSCCWR